ncbi:hypothetical protein AB3X55_10620 [Alphaproteobacteria bacterium LSUCC0719]|jgi:hypothetical protein
MSHPEDSGASASHRGRDEIAMLPLIEQDAAIIAPACWQSL